MRIMLTVLLLTSSFAAKAELRVIAHPAMPPVDAMTLQRIYTGKVVEVAGVRVTPVNLPPGHALRARFLQDYLDQDEDKYTGYWTVRRYVGKGTPPRELADVQAIIRFITATAGAIGYIDASVPATGIQVLAPPTPP